MSQPDLPLGQAESATLEFKSAAVLRSPFAVAREVVGFLNAGSSASVWIGLKESDGRATAVDPVSEPQRAVTDLLNHLVETIEPAITDDEVKVHVVPVSEGGHVLRVEVHPSRKDIAFAALKEGGRFFLLRVANRLRPLTRPEIDSRRSSSTQFAAGEDRARKWLLERRTRVLESKEPCYWLAVRPCVDEPFEDYGFTEEDHLLLADPTQAGNRRSGWTYASRSGELKVEGGILVLGVHDYRSTRLQYDGGLETTAQLRYFDRLGHPVKEIHPLAFLEYTVSFFRLAAQFARRRGWNSEKFLSDVVIAAEHGWTLPALAPDAAGYMMGHEAHRDLKALVLPQPLKLEGEELIKFPDRIGFRIVRIVYQFMGLPDDRIPRQYDRKTERLVLSD